uniref:Cytochrome P450, family 4, subfamily T, polypeptide 8 n=1 Tax=Cyclopterus lumpus TaxID=8103 RepID=A0A8C2X4A7_CYCLU
MLEKFYSTPNVKSLFRSFILARRSRVEITHKTYFQVAALAVLSLRANCPPQLQDRQGWLRFIYCMCTFVFQLKQDGKAFDRTLKWGESYPYAFPLWFGPFICLFNIHHPDYVKTLFESTGEGLLVSQGQKWFRHRRLLTPGFHFDVLKPYINLMSDSTKTMLDKLEKYASGNESFELFEPVSLMSLDTILKCAFSDNSNCQAESGRNTYIQAVYDLSNLISLRLRMFPYHSDFLFYISPHGFRFRKARRVAYRHTGKILRKRKEALKEENELDRIGAKRNLDFLDILLLARKQQGLADEDIRAEVDTFMFEGHDTTASGLSFILYSLACHPEHQKLCREEILQTLDGKDTFDLSKMPYTTMCIKESLRLYPPVPATSRVTTKPMTFCDGRTLPKGCHLLASVFGIHRNAAIWENPHHCVYHVPQIVSFSPFRNCIGQNFAMNELKVATALTLKRYQLIEDPTQKPKLIGRVVLHSINGIHIKIKPNTDAI